MVKTDLRRDERMIVAISGPAASGKGTLARMLAKALGLPHYDFGLMFRAIATLSSNYNANQLLRFATEHKFNIVDGRVWFLENELTSTIKSEDAGLAAAEMALDDLDSMIQISQAMVRHKSFVCDGRTCGSEIYPDANYKFYITAGEKERIKRRRIDGGNMDIFSKRKKMDYGRLKILIGAIIIDTTGKTKEESLRQLLSHIR